MCLLWTSNKTLLFTAIFIIWILLYISILYLLFWFVIFCKMFYFVTFIVLSSFFFLLYISTILFHMSIYVTIEASWLLVFVIIIFGLYNVHEYSSIFIDDSRFYSVVLSFFYGFILLSNWDNCYFSLLEYLWCCYRWIF